MLQLTSSLKVSAFWEYLALLNRYIILILYWKLFRARMCYMYNGTTFRSASRVLHTEFLERANNIYISSEKNARESFTLVSRSRLKLTNGKNGMKGEVFGKTIKNRIKE